MKTVLVFVMGLFIGLAIMSTITLGILKFIRKELEELRKEFDQL